MVNEHDVYNWQLGRDMDYTYEEEHPDRQFAFVFNINRCIGCQTCTMACKSTWTYNKGQEHMWWNNVETKPYGGYPQNWDKKILKKLEQANPGGQTWKPQKHDRGEKQKGQEEKPHGVFAGKTIFEAAREAKPDQEQQRALGYLPEDDEWDAPNIYEDTAKGKGQDSAELPEHKTWFFYLQRICNHCTYPACLAACPRKAIYKRDEDGIVLIDQERCRGYRKCVEACPYKKSMYRSNTGTSEKCIGCYPRQEGDDPELSPDGAPVEARCMTSCVGKIRMQGLVDINDEGKWAHDPQNPIYYMTRVEKVALPLYPQFGTEPNGFYIPPRWVPRDYLQQMFGPGVEDAIERYVNPSRRLMAILQLFRAAQQVIFRYEIEEGEKVAETEVTMPDGRTETQEIYNDTVYGYNAHDEQIIKTTVKEPTFERSEEHYNSI
jgi:nitrate reductase beta subunit